MTRFRVIALIALVCVVVAACGSTQPASGQKQESRQQYQATNSLLQDQPLPHFNFSQIRQNLIEIQKAQANGSQSTSFFFNQGATDPIQECPSIGAPIATTTQLSNPSQVVDGYGRPTNDPNYYGDNGANNVIPQMDPNGVYTGDSSGTYVICLDTTGKPYANYWEGFVQTVFHPATWDKATHSVKLIGDPTFKFTK